MLAQEKHTYACGTEEGLQGQMALQRYQEEACHDTCVECRLYCSALLRWPGACDTPFSEIQYARRWLSSMAAGTKTGRCIMPTLALTVGANKDLAVSYLAGQLLQ